MHPAAALVAESVQHAPPAVVEALRVPAGRVHVVRDDLLPGGTKQRAVIPYLVAKAARGSREMVYASPFCGYAQVALAAGCAAVGLRARVFCEEDPSFPGLGRAHAFARRAAELGASVRILPSLPAAEEAAWRHAHRAGSEKIPLGFDCPLFHDLLVAAIDRELPRIVRRLESPPRRVWLPVGSGTLARAFHRVLPPGISLECVDVRVLPPGAVQLERLRGIPRLRLWPAPERFAEPAELAPPVPSNTHYDAKLWRFITTQARDGDLWWNVGP
jgi:hypothetical protein